MNHPLPNKRLTKLVGCILAICAGFAASLVPAVPAMAQGPTSFVFQGAGWGHGVGMSQNGARNMADAGYDHNGILNHYYPNAVVTSAAQLGNIRVHIGDASRVELSSAGAIVFERGGVAINSIPSGSISVSAHDGGLQIGNAWTTGNPSDPLYVSFPMPVKLANNGHRYLWGKLQLTNRNGKVRVVEDLPLEQYVAGISEMPAAWPLEALMAQAIAARTYAHEVTLHRRNSDEWAQEYDISGTTVDQNYIGWDAQDSAWDQKWLAAVKATAGVEIVDNSGPIRAYYSASNGGYTETAAYVFGNDVPYTVAGPDQFDAGGHNWTEWTRSYSTDAMSRWLNAGADTSVGTLQSITVLGGAGASARLDKAVVELSGSNGTKRVTGKRLMLAINAGVFGEGGGLSEHLPGTFTTIGNGAGAGPPKPGGVPVPSPVTPDPIAEDSSDAGSDGRPGGGFVPPPGWTPEPGTGVAPGQPVAPESGVAEPGDTGDSSDAGSDGRPGGGFVPPPGWTPEPGTGVPPGQPVAPESGVAESATEELDEGVDGSDGGPAGGFVPPPGWTPEPGTGVAPASGAASSGASVEPSYVPPTGWEPEPGTSVAPVSQVGSSVASVEPSYVPPPGWTPEPGTGVAPGSALSPVGSASLASSVLVFTRASDGGEEPTVEFQVLSPADELANEARTRLQAMQVEAAVGLFTEFDIEGYIKAVAPRPVHGVCTSTASGVTCLPLETLRTLVRTQ